MTWECPRCRYLGNLIHWLECVRCGTTQPLPPPDKDKPQKVKAKG